MSEAPAEITSAKALTEALTDRPTAEFILECGDKKYRLHLRAVGYKQHQMMVRDANMQARNAGAGAAGALANLDLQWVQHGVIDPETGTPLFKTKEEVLALLEGHSSAVEELIHRIELLSGHANPVDWDAQLDDTASGLVEAAISGVEGVVRPLVAPECLEAFGATIKDYRMFLESAVRVALDHAGFLCIKKFQYGDTAEGLSEEDLGNSSEQTPDCSTSGVSASISSEDSPVS